VDEVKVIGEEEVEASSKEDMKTEMVAEILNQRPKKIIEIVGLKVEDEIRTKVEEGVTRGPMAKGKYNVITVTNMGVIHMNFRVIISQEIGIKKRKQI